MIVTRIEYSPAAKEDLRQIQKIVEYNFGGTVAKEILTKLTTKVRRLEQFHLSGVQLKDAIGVGVDYRYIFVEKNYIIYRIESESIRIVRILNERQDYLSQLKVLIKYNNIEE